MRIKRNAMEGIKEGGKKGGREGGLVRTKRNARGKDG